MLRRVTESIFNTVDTFLAWLNTSLKQTTESYCLLETADSDTTLVAHDGSLVSVIKVHGVTCLVGQPEFDELTRGVALSLHTAMSQPGHSVQVYFSYDCDSIKNDIRGIFSSARATAQQLQLDLADLFNERVNYLAKYCANEEVYFVLWTHPKSLPSDQLKHANKDKLKDIRQHKTPPFKVSQNIVAAIPDLRDGHEAFVRSVVNDFSRFDLYAELLNVHEAVYAMRMSVDSDFTDRDWRALLPGDKLTAREINGFAGDVSDILWPSLAKQILPRDAENIDMRTARVGDKLYSTVYIDLFPKDVQPFITLLNRTALSGIPWRIAFMLESEGLSTLRFKGMLSTILSFTSSQNRLISDANNLLKYIELNTDDALVRLRVALATWAPVGSDSLLRRRASELAKAVEGWGATEISQMCGDAFAGAVSSMLGVTTDSIGTPVVAPLGEVVKMFPLTRPASPWSHGSLLFRTPDGKPWPYQPGSSKQTTWIDLIYARPGSGKSVLSNAINLALCLSSGLLRLPRIAIIDIGPSSSGLISLLKEALPAPQRHLVAYHRLRMTDEYAVNPFDTQLGCRFPSSQERSFLVNFLTLLTTPLGAQKPYDGIADLAGMAVDELYKEFADQGKPHVYTPGVEPIVDGILEEIGFVRDQQSTWWEVTDALFMAEFHHEAMLSQRYAMPLLADAASICRSSAIEDLYGKIIAPTGESLIAAFSRMVSAAVREYPILSQVTVFDLGEARVVSLDLDEVAKGGGDAADKQAAVMYMLARYILAHHYYLTDESLARMPEQYRDFHVNRIREIREDPKRLVYDEFHRTSKSQAVRDQVILDMREGRKWNVQIACISQSVDDFDAVMIEFATATYIMDAGPAQSIQATAKIFGLNETAKWALRDRVHGPSKAGATFLVQYATKSGVNSQLLTLTLGPIELWAFSTTAEDADLRNRLYKRLNPADARRLLAHLFPNGTVTEVIEKRLADLREKQGEGLITKEAQQSIIEDLVDEVLAAYAENKH